MNLKDIPGAKVIATYQLNQKGGEETPSKYDLLLVTSEEWKWLWDERVNHLKMDFYERFNCCIGYYDGGFWVKTPFIYILDNNHISEHTLEIFKNFIQEWLDRNREVDV